MGTIRIYNADEYIFDHNGICSIKPTMCTITRNLNDYLYYLDLTYPLYVDEKWKEIIENRILYLKDDRIDEYFRIVKITKTNSELSVHCEQIFFDLEKNFIEDTNIVNKNGQEALNQLLNNTQYKHHFVGKTNIKKINNSRIVRYNVISALLGNEDNSFINRWGNMELDMNKFTIILNDKIGFEREYVISYGKNLDSINCEIDLSSVVTQILPVGFDGIMLEEKYVYSNNLKKYPNPIIKEIKYEDVKWKGSPNYSGDGSDAFETLEEARKELKRLAQLEFTLNKIDEPLTTFNVNFIELSRTEEYKDYEKLLTLNIGDTITIRHKLLDIDLTARVIEYTYDFLSSNFTNITLGNYKEMILSEMYSNSKKIDNYQQTLITTINETKKEVSDEITNSLTGYVTKTNSELFIMDTDDTNTAVNVWKLDNNGFSYSSNGINGNFNNEITMNGEILAKYLKGIIASQKNVSWLNLEDGSFSYANGNLTYTSSDGLSIIGQLNADGRILFGTDDTELKILSTDGNEFKDIHAKNVWADNQVYASGVAVTSSRERKKNIDLYKRSSLSDIISTNIYTYHLNEDLNEEMKRIGIIVQDAPVDAVDLSGVGIDLYQMCTMSWKAIQELNNKIELITTELVTVKEENNELKKMLNDATKEVIVEEITANEEL